MSCFEMLPDELQYLIVPAQKYGIYQYSEQVETFLGSITPDQLAELRAVATRVKDHHHYEHVNEWLDRYPLTEFSQAAQLYFLFQIMDRLDLKFETDDWNTVTSHLVNLQKAGSGRQAIQRMLAAKFLADFGSAALEAVPALQRACQDEDERVQVWAHFALAQITGSLSTHEAAIRDLWSRHNKPDEWGSRDAIGTEAQAAIERLTGSRWNLRWLARWFRSLWSGN